MSGVPLGLGGPLLVWTGHGYLGLSLVVAWLCHAIASWWSDRLAWSSDGISTFHGFWAASRLSWEQVARSKIDNASDHRIGIFGEESAFALLTIPEEVGRHAQFRKAFNELGHQPWNSEPAPRVPLSEIAALVVLSLDAAAIAVALYP